MINKVNSTASNNVLRMRALFSTCFLLILTGCAVEAITPQAAQSFASSSIDDFLSQRFSDKQSEKAPAGYVYQAFFNAVNYRQLERPSKEIDAFCLAQNGQLKLSSKYSGNPIGRYVANPLVWAEGYRKYAEKVYPVGAGIFAELGYEDAQKFNHTFRTTEAQETYKKVSSAGAFGLFTCVDTQSLKSKWSVAITPVGFRLKDAGNDLSNNSMFLQVFKVN